MKPNMIYPTIPVSDINRARKFYENLGLTVIDEDPWPGITFKGGDGSVLYIYETAGAGKAEHTLVAFSVEDVEAAVEDLRARGVRFEEFDTPELKTVHGIATIGQVKSAFFRDSEGNILAIDNLKSVLLQARAL